MFFVGISAGLFFCNPINVKTTKHFNHFFTPKKFEICLILKLINIENRIYIREELKESLGMNFFGPFQPEREFKV